MAVTRPAGVLSGRVEQDADVAAGVRQVRERTTPDERGAGGGPGEADHDPHGGGLARAVGAEEAGHPPGPGGERGVVDHGEAAVRLREVRDGDHASSVARATPAGIGGAALNRP
jgi:hypothetical protein